MHTGETISVQDQKKELRRAIRRKARTLDPAYCRAADLAIHEQLFALQEYRDAARIFCFVSRPTEVDTFPIIRDALSSGKLIAVPRCMEHGVMHAYSITAPERDLAPGMYGIQEPSSECPVIAPSALDLILVPCCSCSHDGRRLGFGGGFYDRYLEKTSAVTIALCREELTSEHIPTDPFDRIMDMVLTEAGVFSSVHRQTEAGS